MKHNINELWKIIGDERHIFAEEAVKDIKIAEKSWKGNHDGERRPMGNKVYTNKPFRIWLNKECTEYKLGWLYGEKTWFDTEQEVKDYRDYLAREKRIKEIF